ncbi:MAG: hypothetical protein CBC16_08170 [Verrucomicrobia bacterium TMED56]|nr:MAG: hypothetical protein CBC16_08170 [Verrucomicrobia bacterium TMED56]
MESNIVTKKRAIGNIWLFDPRRHLINQNSQVSDARSNRIFLKLSHFVQKNLNKISFDVMKESECLLFQ